MEPKTTEFAAEILVAAAERVVRATSKPLRNATRRTIQYVTDAYRPFLYKTYQRVKSIRTFLRPTESVDLLSHYVPVDLRSGRKDVVVDDVIDKLSSGERFVISALAGSGKSVLMRYIALTFFHNPRGRVPLFLELRSLNVDGRPSLLSAIHEYYRGNSSIEFDDFERTLRSGYFVLILDGFDEISPANRNDYESQILRLARDFEKLPIIVSGRQDERFNSWEDFSHYYLKEMNYQQARRLIKISNYDDKVREIFLDRMTENFFEQHQSFLQNPLLAIMMMLTFEDYAEIPSTLHEFYRIAFDTLLRRHDAMKGQFLRQSHSSCSTEEFKNIFSSFSLLTYTKSAFSFDRDQAVSFIRAAVQQQGLEKDPELLLSDLIESICLLQQEGFDVSFVHRSFQEYFSAVFIANAGAGFVRRYLEDADVNNYDNVLPMLMGIASQRVETEWANDKVEELADQFPITNQDANLNFHIAAYPEMSFVALKDRAILVDIKQTRLARDMRLLEAIYPEERLTQLGVMENSSRDDEADPLDWEVNVTRALRELQESGDPEFAHLEEVLSIQEERGRGNRFTIRITQATEVLMGAVFGSTYDTRVQFIDAVRTLQRDRQARANTFVGEIFGSIEIM